MDHKTIDAVLLHAARGRQILYGDNHTGRVKIKVKYGPLGLISARYPTDRETMNEIKSRLKLSEVL